MLGVVLFTIYELANPRWRVYGIEDSSSSGFRLVSPVITSPEVIDIDDLDLPKEQK